MTEHEPSVLTKIIVSVAVAIVGPVIMAGGLALGQWWFTDPGEPFVSVECDDDYEYDPAVDDTFVNDHGDVCVKHSQETWQTVAETWGWPFPVTAVATIVVVVVAVGLVLGGLTLAFGGIGSMWERPRGNRYR